MVTDLNIQPDISKEEELTNDLQEAKDSDPCIPDKEVILKELDNYRMAQICKELPDHCIQLCFLS